MYGVSSNFLTAVQQAGRVFKSQATVTKTGYADLALTDTQIISFKHSAASISGQDFEIGATCAAEMDMEISNLDGSLSAASFQGATVTAAIGIILADTSIEYCPLGVFYVDSVSRTETSIKLVCYDAMLQLETLYQSTLTYPATLLQIAQDIASKAGLTLATTTFPNPTFSVAKKPSLCGITLRAALSWVAEAAACFARINRSGQLELAFYVNTSTAITASNYYTLTHDEQSRTAITQVTIKQNADDTGVSSGTAGNTYTITGNPLLVTNAIGALTAIYAQLHLFVYMPFTSKWQGNPACMAGDIISITDRNSNTYVAILTESEIEYDGGLTGNATAKGLTTQAQTFQTSAAVASAVAEAATNVQTINNLLAGNITATNIATGSLTADRLQAGTITAASGVIANAAIGTAHIQDAAITGAKIGSATITNANIANATITAAQITSATITAANIANATITAAQIANATIAAANIASATITTVQIAAATITGANIALATITGANIASATIATANISTGAITNALIGTGAIATAQIADGSITDAKIVGLTANKITAGTIDASVITVTNLNCANLTVGTINGTQISAATVTSSNIADGTIQGSDIKSGTITNTLIAATTITGDRLVAGTITASQIASATITATQIAANTITAAKIVAGTITTTEIAANTITASDIAAGTITATQIAANTITGANIAAGTITATNIDVTNLSVYKVQAQSDSTAYLTMTSAGMSLYRGSALSLTITADSGSNYASIIPKGLYNGLWLGTDTGGVSTATGLWITNSGCFFTTNGWGQISIGYNSWVTFTDPSNNVYALGGASGARWSTVPIVGTNGVMEIGQYIDFHESATDTSDYSSRLYSSGGTITTMGNFNCKGQLTTSGSTYPQIIGDGTTLQISNSSSTTAGIVIQGGTCRPAKDNQLNLGASSQRWATVYAVTSTINTSDRNEKNTIAPLDTNKATSFISALNPVSYKYNSGTSDRLHYGLIAQDVEDEMTVLGMASNDFAGFVKSPKIDDDGNDVSAEDGYIYGLRYEEFISPLIKTVQGLLTRCAALEKTIKKLQSAKT